MINAKDARYLTNETITRNKLKALNVVEVRIKNAIAEGEYTITVGDVFLNEDCIEVLKDNGYVLKSFANPHKTGKGWIISW